MQRNSQILPFRSTWHEAPWTLHLERHRHDKNSISGCLNPFPIMEGVIPISLRERKRAFASVMLKKIITPRNRQQSSGCVPCVFRVSWATQSHSWRRQLRWAVLFADLGVPKGHLAHPFHENKACTPSRNIQFQAPKFGFFLFFPQNHKGKILYVHMFLRNETRVFIYGWFINLNSSCYWHFLQIHCWMS